MPHTPTVLTDEEAARNAIYLMAYRALLDHAALPPGVIDKDRYRPALDYLCSIGHIEVHPDGYRLTPAGIAYYRQQSIGYWSGHSSSRIHPPKISQLFDEDGNEQLREK